MIHNVETKKNSRFHFDGKKKLKYLCNDTRECTHTHFYYLVGTFSLWTVFFFCVFKNQTTKHGARAICSMPTVSFERIVSVRTMLDAIRCRCSGRIILSKYVRSIEQHGPHSVSIRYWMHIAQRTPTAVVFRSFCYMDVFVIASVCVCVWELDRMIGMRNINIPPFDRDSVVGFNVCQAVNARNHKNMLIFNFLFF